MSTTRPRSLVTQNCETCGDPFTRPVRYAKRGPLRFCSSKCCGAARPKPEPNSECAVCGKAIYRQPSQLAQSKSGLVFCSRACKGEAQKIGGAIAPAHYGTGMPRPNKDYRRRALDNLPHLCGRCGYDKTPAILVVHHRDHDRSNNELENLEILCPNCHAEHHYG